MGRPLKYDLQGQRFTRLVALEHLGSGRWRCMCDCGNETVVQGGLLRNGNTKSCGCLNNSPMEDLVGRQFERLTVREYVGDSKWRCLCSCGNETVATTGSLKGGSVKSCGCLYREVAGKATFDDKTGRRYGRLTVLRYLGNRRYLCECDCGNVKDVDANELSRGSIRSCGCLQRESARDRHTKHGYAGTRLYKVWCSMRQRCNNENQHAYKNYGAKGVKVCSEWDDFAAFHDWAYANGYDENAKLGDCTIDRIDPYGDYEPSNCRWVDLTVQANNKRAESSGRKPVEQIDEDGNVVDRYESMDAAAKATGIHPTSISMACRKVIKTTHATRWRYAEENDQGGQE